jgi:hypothetical protein
MSGQLTPTCLTMALSPFDLTGLNVTFAKVDDSTISLTANAGCVVHFHVSGNQATVAASQTCALDVGGALGMQSIAITKWTLTLSGDHMDADIAGTASICTAAGTAVLVKGVSDAGVGGRRDGGGRDVASEAGASDGGAPEAAAAEGGADGGAPEASLEVGAEEVGAEAGVDAGADAPADAPAAETD